MNENQKKVLAGAIQKYGVPHQLNIMAVEELSELIQAITKAQRAGIVKEWGIQPPCKESSMKQIEAYNNLCKEAADIEIVLEQVKMMLNPDFYNTSLDRKINRLQETINKQ